LKAENYGKQRQDVFDPNGDANWGHNEGKYTSMAGFFTGQSISKPSNETATKKEQCE